MNNEVKRLELEGWISDFCKSTVSKLLYEVAKESEKRDVDYSVDIKIHLISTLIGVTLYSHLRDFSLDKTINSKDKEKKLIKEYTMLKALIQSSIGNGFSGAMSTFSGKQADYYCLIKPVPPAINKQPC